jgi:hypothetical protein
MPLVFGSTKYREVAALTKRLKKAKTSDDKRMIQRNIEFLQAEIRKEEKEFEEYLAKM